jgi:uncharacterized protein DUF5677
LLPHEAEVTAEIANKYRAQLDAMTALHEAVVGMLTVGSWKISKPGPDWVVVQTMLGLLTKACKTFRSIQILCERGLQEDAHALVRVLMETAAAVLFILQKKSRERARIYHAHGIAQDVKMLNEWTSTRGLKRKVTKKLMKQATDALADATKKLPTGTDVKHHWSGKRNLFEAVRAIRGDVLYATLYRFTSSISHASDFGAHLEIDSTVADPIWQIEPRAKGLEAPSYMARELLWHLASRIDARLGLGFSAALAPHKLTRAHVREGEN